MSCLRHALTHPLLQGRDWVPDEEAVEGLVCVAVCLQMLLRVLPQSNLTFASEFQEVTYKPECSELLPCDNEATDSDLEGRICQPPVL